MLNLTLIDNQALNTPKNQTLVQSPTGKKGNSENYNNKSSKGVSSKHHQHSSPPIVGETSKKGNDENKLLQTKEARRISEFFPRIFPKNQGYHHAKPGDASSGGQPASDNHADYHSKLGLAQRLSDLAKNELNYYAFMAWTQMHRNLYNYRDFTPETHQIAMKMMRLHLVRLQNKDSRKTLKTCHSMISRAIYLASRWLNQENQRRKAKDLHNFYIYAPSTYLSLDENVMKKGVFRIVVDKWLKEEYEKRKRMAQKGSALIDYQFALQQQDTLSQKIIDTLKKEGFGAAFHQLKTGYETLQVKLSNLNLSQKLKDRIVDSYINRSYYIKEI